MRIAIIGAGAAGCFCAINLKRMLPQADVHVFEAGKRALVKVGLTGGGRCNISNTFEGVEALGRVYPRGERLMKRVLHVFGWEECRRWFEREGLRLFVQEDRRVFPVSEDAGSVVGLLLGLMRKEGVELHLGRKLSRLGKKEGGESFVLRFEGGESFEARGVVVAMGGVPGMRGFDIFEGLDLKIAEPVASLFSFKIADEGLRGLMGLSVERAQLRIVGENFRSEGALLLTHWGMSGPAVLSLSSYAARWLAERGYEAEIGVNWLGMAEEELRRRMEREAVVNGARGVAGGVEGWDMPLRLWRFLVARAGVKEGVRWGEIGRKGLNRMVSVLCCDVYGMRGKNRFKEEFVTCGGVETGEVDMGTMECRRHKGLFFAGEVLDVDAVTGGFNLQAAWGMGFVAARGAAERFGERCEE